MSMFNVNIYIKNKTFIVQRVLPNLRKYNSLNSKCLL